MRAYEDALSRCNPPEAPWYIIPSDRKWYRNLKVSEIILEMLEAMNPQFPSGGSELDDTVITQGP
jgi:polyphosphate kinase 2 (PPK2 family)